MARVQAKSSKSSMPVWYRGKNVPMSVIRRFARQVAEKFHPDKIVLFGSHAYGTPHDDSDVDILVVMPAYDQLSKAVKIELTCDPPFPLDIIVRTPEKLRRWLEDGESFHSEIMSKGKVLYEKGNSRMGTQGQTRLPRRRTVVSRS